MAWFPAAVTAGSLMYIYKEGVPQAVKDWANTNSSDAQSSRDRSQQSQQSQQPQPPIQQMPQQPLIVTVTPTKSHTWLYLSSAALLSLGGYYWYLQRNSTKKVINKVEETAEDTQALVIESDQNNEKRFGELEEKNAERADELSSEVRGEQRAHFEILSQQLFVVSQVCLETLSHVASGISGNAENDEFSQPNERLVAYTEQAQEKSERLFDTETYLRSREQHVTDLRATLGQRSLGRRAQANAYAQAASGGQTATPGGETPGGDDFNDSDYYGAGGAADESPYITNISVDGKGYTMGSKRRKKAKKDEEAKHSSVLEYDIVKKMELSHISQHYVVKWVDPIHSSMVEHKNEIAIASAFSAAVYGVKLWLEKQHNKGGLTSTHTVTIPQ